jgi:spermidine synthase
MKTALKMDGILCCPGECGITEMRQFPVMGYIYCTIPTHPCSQTMLNCKIQSTNFLKPYSS